MEFHHSPSGKLYHDLPSGRIWLGPLLSEIAIDSEWAASEIDEFPSDQQWSDAFEQMLFWFAGKFPCEDRRRIVGRLRGMARSRDETFAEILAAYFIETACHYNVTEWEPKLPGGRTADFEISIPAESSVVFALVEVKAPSWTGQRIEEVDRQIEALEVGLASTHEAEARADVISQLECKKRDRRAVNKRRKYDILKAKSFDNREFVEHGLRKICGAGGERLPKGRLNLLVFVDDVEPFMHWPGGEPSVTRALYHPPSIPVYKPGLFWDAGFGRITAVATFERRGYGRDAMTKNFSPFSQIASLSAHCPKALSGISERTWGNSTI